MDNQYGYQNMDNGSADNVAKKENKKTKIWLVALCFALVGSLLGSVLTTVIYHFGFGSSGAGGDIASILLGRRETSIIERVPIDTDKLLTPAEVYAANVNSTVGITTSITTNFWGFETVSAASGSGFILSDTGYILTNHHVIDGANSITVSTYDGKAYDAKLIGYDASNDVAVLKIEAEGLIPVIIGDSDNLNVGDNVVAIGNPLGELTFSLTGGYVSAKDRKITLSSNVTMELIQTDCAINSGNSGGALFNLYGEVIGITNAKYSSNSFTEASIDNIGFAIPINDAMRIAESIIEKGYISKPYIGVSISDVSSEAQQYGVPKGAAIQGVVEDAPADKAGLLVGDVITKVDETVIESSDDLIELVEKAEIGAKLKFTVYRKGEILDLTVEIEEKRQSAVN